MPLPTKWKWKLERWREQLGGLVRGGGPREEGRPRLCPACRALVGASAERCHECGAHMTYSLPAVSRSLAKLLPAESPVTHILLSLTVLLFAVCLMATVQQTGQFGLFMGIHGEVLFRLGARFTPLILQGEWWRLVMPIFLHGSLFHIGMNMLVLKDVGPELEEVYGSARYLFFYMVTGVAGFVVSTLWGMLRLAMFIPPGSDYFRLAVQSSGGISIGASGALMGLLGLMLGITTRRGGAYIQAVRWQLLRSVMFIFLIGLLLPAIDNAAHLGGLAAGFLFGKYSADREPLNSRERNRAFALGWIGALLAIGGFAAMLARFFAGR